jgi:hypothetical protein
MPICGRTPPQRELMQFAEQGASQPVSERAVRLFGEHLRVAPMRCATLTVMPTVYCFTKYDGRSDQIIRSKRPATLDAIRWAGGELTHSSRLSLRSS